jgi:hypothetical protein
LSGSTASAFIAAAAALLLGVSGGISFVGFRRDATAVQTKILNKHRKVNPERPETPEYSITKEEALKRANRRLSSWRWACFITWILAVVGLVFTFYFALAPRPAVNHNKSETMREIVIAPPRLHPLIADGHDPEYARNDRGHLGNQRSSTGRQEAQFARSDDRTPEPFARLLRHIYARCSRPMRTVAGTHEIHT